MLTPNNNNHISVHPKPRPLVEQDFEVIGLSDDGGLGVPSSKFKPSPRRSSWQPGRKSKTVEEIEKECDDDDDDEIPEDTVFWNIPLSPRAGKTLASSSKSPSPERSSADEGGENGDNGELKSEASESTVSLPSLSRSESGESESRGRLKSRGKSWGDVMHELGDDAKDLTEALERYADESMEAQEKDLQRKVAEARGLSTTPPKRDVSRIALPPKQVSDIGMDPLPMSKEKEAALSRTRPGWLPPKAKHEEEKHLKEYQEMMRLSLEYDRRRAEKEKMEAATPILEASTRELWWQGISPRSRGIVWKRAIGNALAVNDETYTIALERAKKLEEELNASEERNPQKDQFADIRKDAERAFPDLKLFQSGHPLHESLVDVLMAYSVYRKDIGYTFGLHAVAANLLLNLAAPDAFQALANLLNRSLPLSFYIQDEPQITNIYNAFLRAFQYKLPSLYQHLHIKLQLPPPLYLEAMFTSLFSLHVPIDIATRLWDVYAFEGDAFLIRTAVAVLTVLEGRLYGSKEEVVALLGWEGAGCRDKSEWRLGKEDEFMAKAPTKKRSSIRAKASARTSTIGTAASEEALLNTTIAFEGSYQPTKIAKRAAKHNSFLHRVAANGLTNSAGVKKKVKRSRGKEAKSRGKLVTSLSSLADALPDFEGFGDDGDEDGEDGNEGVSAGNKMIGIPGLTDVNISFARTRSGNIAQAGVPKKMKSLGTKRGMSKKKEKLEAKERTRFQQNVAVMMGNEKFGFGSGGAAGDGGDSEEKQDGGEVKAGAAGGLQALRAFIHQNMAVQKAL
ncbi:Drainin [Dactylella cylindrospora]|nr:Drainin [Dactylella cylindrospora]